MQMRKHTGSEEFDHYQIPKDISKLPILSMLINCKIPRTESITSVETTMTFAKPKILNSSRAEKVCPKHTNEKLRYLWENTGEVTWVYCAFAMKQSDPDLVISELDQTLSNLLKNFEVKYGPQFSLAMNFFRQNKSKIAEMKETNISKINECYERIMETITVEKKTLVDRILDISDKLVKECTQSEKQAQLRKTKFER